MGFKVARTAYTRVRVPGWHNQAHQQKKGSAVEEQPIIEPIEVMAKVVITGKSPLVHKNPRSADPDDEMKIAIDQITAKGKDMTTEDRRRKEALQWRQSLYTDDVKDDSGEEPRERVITPMMWLTRSFEEGGKTLGSGTASKGAAVFRSVSQTETQMILHYDGPQDIADLAKDPRFRWRTMANPNPTGGKVKLVPLVRAIFPTWQVTTTLSVVTSMGLSWDNFMRALHAAGNCGIGDARKLGYGRYHVKITKLR
jgi:hypothetical protein